MSKNVKINGTTYSGVSSVSLPLADGSGNVLFRENSEVINTPTAALSVTANGTYNVTNYASAVVSVASSSSVSLQSKSVTPSASAQTVTADSGYTGLFSVTVAAVQTQSKSVTPSTSAQTVTADTGKYLSQVTVAAVSGSPVLSALSVSPTTMTVANGSTSDTVKGNLTAMSGTYTLSGYTGTLSADLTAYISSVTVSGTMPAAGNTAAMTVSYGGKSAVVSVTMEAAASTEPQVTVTQSGTGYSIEELNGATSGTVEAKSGFLELVVNITSGYTSDGTFTVTKNGETLTSGVTVSGDDSSGYALSVSGLSDGDGITVALTTTKSSSTTVTSSAGTGSNSTGSWSNTLAITQETAVTGTINKITITMNDSLSSSANVNNLYNCNLTKNSSGNWEGTVRVVSNKANDDGWRNFVSGEYAIVTISDGKVTQVVVPHTYINENLPSFSARFMYDIDGVSPSYNVTVECV
jgi:hypothetical protein